MIRNAKLKDLDALVALESSSFDNDRLTRRNFRHLLTRGKAVTLVFEQDDLLLGYVMLLFHAGTSLARLYSLAVDSHHHGRGIAHALLEAAEKSALDRGCISLRLEVRKDNPGAIRLYEKHGFSLFGTRPDYYEDHMTALRYEKRLEPALKSDLARVPYYKQTLEFTCGPSALMMAMKALDDDIELTRTLELRLWRDATTIFMTSGHGGCGPYGLALSAYHEGFDVSLYLNHSGTMFIDSVRSEEKKEVMTLVQDDFIEQLSGLPVEVHYHALGIDQLREEFDKGGIPIILISSYRIYHEKFPHWVVVTGFDDKFVYVHDPYVDYEKGKASIDSVNMPIPQTDFMHMARYGKNAQQAQLILKKRKKRVKRNKT
jgi:ribosomal protein S18 acetylase RimI-like enzyme